MSEYFKNLRQTWLHQRVEPFNRKDLMCAFDISIAQASSDISLFNANNPNVFKYCKKLKRYERQIQGIDKPMDVLELKAIVRTHVPDFAIASMIMSFIK